MSRRTDRRHIFCLIFQLEFLQGADISAVFDSYMENHVSDAIDSEFVFKQFAGVYQNLDKIDEIISETLKAWTTDRLNKSDFAILRLAVYEMMYNDEIPDSVAINEAVELAKLYCDDSSPGSINAILGTILKSKGKGLTPC